MRPRRPGTQCRVSVSDRGHPRPVKRPKVVRIYGATTLEEAPGSPKTPRPRQFPPLRTSSRLRRIAARMPAACAALPPAFPAAPAAVDVTGPPGALGSRRPRLPAATVGAEAPRRLSVGAEAISPAAAPAAPLPADMGRRHARGCFVGVVCGIATPPRRGAARRRAGRAACLHRGATPLFSKKGTNDKAEVALPVPTGEQITTKTVVTHELNTRLSPLVLQCTLVQY